MTGKKIGLFAAVLLCVLCVYLNKDLLFVSPVEDISFENIVYVTQDDQKNMYVLDASGERLSKVDENNVLLWQISASDDKFQEAESVVVNGKGEVFVQGQVKQQGSFKISTERIVSYDTDGKFLGIVAEHDYEEPVLSSRIAGMFPTEDGLVYAFKKDNSFSVYDQNGNLLKECELEHAGYLPSIAWSRQTGEVYYATFGGLVCRYIDGSADEVLYDASAAQELSVPKEISLDEEGNLYVADIGFRDVLKIDASGEVERIYEDVDFYEKEITYYLNADHGLITCTEYSVKQYQDGEYQYLTSCSMSAQQKVLCVLVWIAVLLLGFACLAAAWIGVRYLLYQASKFTKMAAAMILGVSGMAVMFAGILIPQFQELTLEAIVTRAKMASEIMIENLPYEEFSRLDSAADFMSEDYLAVKEAAMKVFAAKNGSVQDLYCAFYRVQDGMIVGTYCLQEDTGAIYPYYWSYEDSDEKHIIDTREGNVYSDIQTSEGSYLLILDPIIDDKDEVIGLLEVGTDLNSFREANTEIISNLLINILAITVVIILIVMELIIFGHAKSRYDAQVALAGNKYMVQVPADILRIIVFAIFFLTNMATAFLPVYAMRLAENGGITAIPAEVMAALPISAEVVVGAAFSVFGNYVLKKLGMKRSVGISAILFTVGFALRIVPDIWLLTLGNAIIGAGWGLLLLIVNTMIAMMPEAEKDEGFAAYNAAALNGVNCGVVFGGFLVNWFSYSVILGLATVSSVVVYILVKKYLVQSGVEEAEAAAGEEETPKLSTIRFLLNGRVFTYFVMIVIPIIACGYFMTYMFPILASEYGLQEAHVGYSYLLNGLCVMCFSNLLTNFFSQKNRKRMALVLSAVIYVIAFMIVAWYQSIPALMVVIVLLGLADSFGLPVQTGYYTDLEEVKQYGYDRAIGIYSLFENGSQAAGSFVFSYVLLIGVREGMSLLAGLILVMALLFLASSFIRPRK